MALLLAVPIASAGTVVLHDEARGLVYQFMDRKGTDISRTTLAPFSASVDDTDEAGGGASARVRGTYESVLGTSLNESSGSLAVDRTGRPAGLNALFQFEFSVQDGPVDAALVIDAAYQRSAGEPAPVGAVGRLVIQQTVDFSPGGRPVVVFAHDFTMGEGDGTEMFRRGPDGGGGANGDGVRLAPGLYALVFNLGLPEIPPDQGAWDLTRTATDRSDSAAYTLRARFTSVGGGGEVIPLPPAVLSGGALLAALGVVRAMARASRCQFRRRKRSAMSAP